jgi:hypothetical protein
MIMIRDGGLSSGYDVVEHLALKLGSVGVGVQLRRSHCARECVCMDGYVYVDENRYMYNSVIEYIVRI